MSLRKNSFFIKAILKTGVRELVSEFKKDANKKND